jgi:hypothetical protein
LEEKSGNARARGEENRRHQPIGAPGSSGISPYTLALDEGVVLKSLLNALQREILFATLDRAKSIEEISRDSGIPMSTCYVKVAELVSGGVLRLEKEGLTRNRKIFALYRATIRTIILGFSSEGLDVVAVANGDEALKPFDVPAPLVAMSRRRVDR